MTFNFSFWKYGDQDGESRFRLQSVTTPKGVMHPARGIDLVQEVLSTGRVATYLVERLNHQDGVKIPVQIRGSIPTKGVELKFQPCKGVYALARANRIPAKGLFLAPDEGILLSDGVINAMAPVIG
jgi:hypothetical protein